MTMGWAKIRQAAAYAGVSTRTMRDWLRMGLKYSRVRGCILIQYSDVDAFIERFAMTEDAVDRVVDEVINGFHGRQ